MAETPIARHMKRARKRKPSPGRWKALRVLTDPDLTSKAREEIAEALDAYTVKSAPVTMIKATNADERKKAIVELDRECDRLFGRGNWTIRAGRIFWLEVDYGTRLTAARAVVDRAEPLPNRVDAAATGSYDVRLVDPNDPAQGVRISSVPEPKDAPGIPPPREEKDVTPK